MVQPTATTRLTAPLDSLYVPFFQVRLHADAHKSQQEHTQEYIYLYEDCLRDAEGFSAIPRTLRSA